MLWLAGAGVELKPDGVNAKVTGSNKMFLSGSTFKIASLIF
jgi:hypothetical protein